jgi:hypothetical protein
MGFDLLDVDCFVTPDLLFADAGSESAAAHEGWIEFRSFNKMAKKMENPSFSSTIFPAN